MEDPSEAFEDLRDKVDLKFLLSHTQFISEAYGEENAKGKGKGKGGLGKLNPPADKEWVEKWRKELKMATVRSPSSTTSVELSHSRWPSSNRHGRAAPIRAPDGDAHPPPTGPYGPQGTQGVPAPG